MGETVESLLVIKNMESVNEASGSLAQNKSSSSSCTT